MKKQIFIRISKKLTHKAAVRQFFYPHAFIKMLMENPLQM